VAGRRWHKIICRDLCNGSVVFKNTVIPGEIISFHSSYNLIGVKA